jgi:hypothetical protein
VPCSELNSGRDAAEEELWRMVARMRNDADTTGVARKFHDDQFNRFGGTPDGTASVAFQRGRYS